MRDLLDEAAETWEAERCRTVRTGWVAEMLEHHAPDGSWPKGRWTDSPWALLLLVACGLSEDHPSAAASAERQLGRFIPAGEEVDGTLLLKRMDLCHLGFWLGLGAYFLSGDARLARLGETVLSAQLNDGGWNCHIRRRPKTSHSSFHTTFNVLEGLRMHTSEEQSTRARSVTPRRARSSSCSHTACTAPTRWERSSPIV